MIHECAKVKSVKTTLGNGKKWEKERPKYFYGKIWKSVNMYTHAWWSWLGHPALFNVTLTSKQCVQELNAHRKEQVFI